MPRKNSADSDLAALDSLVQEITTDAFSEDEQLWAFLTAFEDSVDFPSDAFVAGQPISVTRIDYDGNQLRGLTALCHGRDGAEHVVAACDVVFPPGTDAALHVAAYRRWLGLDPWPAASLAAPPSRKAHHKATAGDIDRAQPVDLVVLSVKNQAVRCRLLHSSREITFRGAGVWHAIPGSILTVQPHKQWSYAGHPYLSGQILSFRIDATALGLDPLKLEELGMWDPAKELWCDSEDPPEEWEKQILEHGPRPEYEMEQVMPGGYRDDQCPITDALDLWNGGDRGGAERSLQTLCGADLRCLDAHAHLGSFAFEYDLPRAFCHYEVGVRIGELSLGPDFDGVLQWGFIDNRPFLRCMHGYGLCLWRMKRFDEAARIFTRMLRLNPRDNQGVRSLVGDVANGVPWDAWHDTWEGGIGE